MARKRVALFYYSVVEDNAIGRCNRIILDRLSDKYDFTVFAITFDNPRPDRIRWVPVRCIQRPLFLLYITYRIAAWIAYVWDILSTKQAFKLAVASDGCIDFAPIAHVHFCNRLYCKRFLMFRDLLTPRGFASAIDHLVRSFREGALYRASGTVIVPSEGLRKELIDVYRVKPKNIQVISNPVDLRKYSPNTSCRERLRSDFGLQAQDIVLVFVALGHFERKGLGPLIEALAEPELRCVHLLVVGGSRSATSVYRKRARDLGIEENVIFCGHHADTRPYLWVADAFVLPSRYETFSLVAVEAAACGLPVIATNVNGIEDWALTGVTGYVLPGPTVFAIIENLRAFIELSRAEQKLLGENARNAISRYDVEEYVNTFELVYDRYLFTGQSSAAESASS